MHLMKIRAYIKIKKIKKKKESMNNEKGVLTKKTHFFFQLNLNYLNSYDYLFGFFLCFYSNNHVVNKKYLNKKNENLAKEVHFLL